MLINIKYTLDLISLLASLVLISAMSFGPACYNWYRVSMISEQCLYIEGLKAWLYLMVLY